jgi:hypothetical protein
MFADLVAFRKTHGHCNVPEQWPQNRKLANWVHIQRHRKRKGKLPEVKVRRLERIGFLWAIYKTARVKPVEPPAPEPEIRRAPRFEQRLYSIRNGLFVQYNGRGKMPKELAAHILEHNREYPPYIPLPRGTTTFHLGSTYLTHQKVSWNGRSSLPQRVLDYVIRKGNLPAYD